MQSHLDNKVENFITDLIFEIIDDRKRIIKDEKDCPNRLEKIKRSTDSDTLKKILNNKDAKGITPLMLANSLGKISISNWLIENGADITVKDADGHTYQHYLATHLFDLASKNLYLRIMLILEQCNWDVLHFENENRGTLFQALCNPVRLKYLEAHKIIEFHRFLPQMFQGFSGIYEIYFTLTPSFYPDKFIYMQMGDLFFIYHTNEIPSPILQQDLDKHQLILTKYDNERILAHTRSVKTNTKEADALSFLILHKLKNKSPEEATALIDDFFNLDMLLKKLQKLSTKDQVQNACKAAYEEYAKTGDTNQIYTNLKNALNPLRDFLQSEGVGVTFFNKSKTYRQLLKFDAIMEKAANVPETPRALSSYLSLVG